MFLAHVVPPFAARGLSGNTDEKADWRKKWERLELLGGLHNKPLGCGASGAYALGPDEKKKEEQMHYLLTWFKSFKFTLKYKIISLLHVSVFNGHHQGTELRARKIKFREISNGFQEFENLRMEFSAIVKGAATRFSLTPHSMLTLQETHKYLKGQQSKNSQPFNPPALLSPGADYMKFGTELTAGLCTSLLQQ